MPNTFADTLAAAKRGDQAAFMWLFRDTQPAVLRYLRVVADDRCERIAGDTWVRVARRLDSCGAGDAGDFRAWVLSIARRRWYDGQRTRGFRAARDHRTGQPDHAQPRQSDQPGKPARPGDVETARLELMSTETALALIASLPRDQAEALALRVAAGLDVARTAEVLGRQPGAVRVLSHRGLRGLQRMLTPAGQPRLRPDQV